MVYILGQEKPKDIFIFILVRKKQKISLSFIPKFLRALKIRNSFWI